MKSKALDNSFKIQTKSGNIMRLQNLITIFMFVILLLSHGVNAAKQSQFVISTFFDPSTSSGFDAIQKANFNVNGGYIWPYDYSVTRNTTILAAAKGKVSSFVVDGRLQNGSVVSSSIVKQIASDYSGYNVLGYNFPDEPNADPAFPYNWIIANIDTLKQANPNALAMINLSPDGNQFGSFEPNSLCYGNDDLCQSGFRTYVQDFFKSSIDIVSFDFYQLYDNNPISGSTSSSVYPLKYDQRSAPTTRFFYSNQVFATYAKQYGKKFWGFGLATESSFDQSRCYTQGTCQTEHIHYPIPSLETSRYYIGAGVAYGIKGFQWFTFELPSSDATYQYFNSPSSNSNIYSTIRFANGELKNCGPILMSASWKNTSHGTSTDPLSGESGLPLISDSLNSILSNIISDGLGNLAIGKFTSYLGKQMLIVFNKNLTYPTTLSAQFINQGANMNIQKFVKHTSRWENVSTGSNNFGVTIAPGDFEIIVANDSNSRVIGSTNGVGQTRAVFNANNITFYVGNADGTYSTQAGRGQSSTYVVGNNGKDFLEGDFNGDGKIDLIHIIPSGNIARLWLSNSSGVPNHLINNPIIPQSGETVGNASQYLVGNFNGNGVDGLAQLDSGKMDIWTGSSSGTFQVLYGWAPSSGVVFNSDINKYKVADYTGDGKSDILCIIDGNIYRILSGNNNQQTPFTYTANSYVQNSMGANWTGYALPTDTRTLHLITANNDSKMDLAWLPPGQNSHIWTSEGTVFRVTNIHP
jgi:hypothetical protein